MNKKQYIKPEIYSVNLESDTYILAYSYIKNANDENAQYIEDDTEAGDDFEIN